jgi:phage tail sheath protein FI
MSFLVSPGVEVKEIDITNVIPAVATSIGGIVGNFRWGEADKVITVGSEKDLVATFGKPGTGSSFAQNAQDFFSAASFLKYGNQLKVVRSVSGTIKNATSDTDGVSSITITEAGNGYVTVPAVTVGSADTTNSAGVSENITATARMQLHNDTALDGTTMLQAQGSGYAVGDQIALTISGVTSDTEALLKVKSVSAGAVTALEIVNAGIYTSDSASDSPNGLQNSPIGASPTAISVETPTSRTGSGVGLIFKHDALSLEVKDIQFNNGIGYSIAPTVTIAAPTGLRIGSIGYSGGAATTATATATLQGEGIDYRNKETFDADSSKTGVGSFVARCAGTLGNGIQIDVLTATSYAASSLKGSFNSVPGSNEVHILVRDTSSGAFTGTASSELEKYSFVSVTSTAKKDDGSSNYYVDVINENSQFIYAMDDVVDASSSSDISKTLSGGNDGTAVTGATLTAAYSTFLGDSETEDVNLLIGGAQASADASAVIDVAESRKDCIAFVSPPVSLTNTAQSVGTKAAAVISWADAIDNTLSYGVMDSSAIYVYDKYNDRYVWIGASGSVAGLCANTDNVADAWFSPAGFNRGGIRGITKLGMNPGQTERDTLYRAKVNPIVSFPGQGTVLFGDKTTQAKPSAFDRINVRRLFLVLEKAISTSAKFQLFELNDEFTRAQFRNLVEPFLRDVKGRRGITDFLVVCDETNNTGEVIDSNRFVADIFIKPARSINFITLNFVATRTGVEFSEVVGSV